ncbi:hypothetical protein LRS10_13580 [Phenylobacterium sp. J426]|uniref:hypothetical protein n=1 Tax=Phenylobacterium sp. J426 TaxID=2898439 RepID=UPI00215150B6|nr:hypothetical protein [Phenylobacterium sp. J426]MCR5875124.1 hypothetical protein [Phenylobacterium sp. J426]
MFDLRDFEHAALADLTRAGAEGLTLDRVGTSAAIRLQLLGLAKINREHPQRVFVTQKGAAFARRGVFV